MNIFPEEIDDMPSDEITPNKLSILAIDCIITNDIEFRHVSLPQEVCHQLLESFRLKYMNKQITPWKLSKFICQFSTNNTRLTKVSLSGLPISDDDLLFILLQHAKTLKYLNIDNCNHLTTLSVRRLKEIFESLYSDDRRVISVDISEIKDGKSQTLLCKRYEDGKIMSLNGEVAEIGTGWDFLSILEAMNVFEYGFCKFRDKLEQDIKLAKVFFANSSDAATDETVIDKIYDKNGALICERIMIYKTWMKSFLETLIIGNSCQILPKNSAGFELVSIHFALDLYLHTLVINSWAKYLLLFINLNSLLTPKMDETLRYLDLSHYEFVDTEHRIANLVNLEVLMLFNCKGVQYLIPFIEMLKSLRYLDISSTIEVCGRYNDPNEVLDSLVSELHNLTHLDISGTNLDGPRHSSIIQGLKSRYSRPFEFLGLYETASVAAYHPTIPALKVAGEASEDQILTACEVYMNRAEMLKKCLNDLFHCFRYGTHSPSFDRSLNVVLQSMSRHFNDKQIQIAASASLFFIVKSDEAKNKFSVKIKRRIISLLLDSMKAHEHETDMLRNGSLILINFSIPQDVLFDYTRLVEVLLHIIVGENDVIQKVGIFLLNSLVCSVDGEKRSKVGELGAIDKILDLIGRQLEKKVCDEVMETAWSTMWNVTDENPANCKKFLDKEGLFFFEECIREFPDNTELLRNMMGLLGNVAECKDLRGFLMQNSYIHYFLNLLNWVRDTIEVSYNTVAILSHIVSDGPSVWEQYLMLDYRQEVLTQMKNVIGTWNLDSTRNINYRSFEPILRLLNTDEPCYEAQYWAVWALANLTRVSEDKYCPLMIRDQGLSVLNRLLSDSDLPFHVRNLALITVFQVCTWQEFRNSNNSDKRSLSSIDNMLPKSEDEIIEKMLYVLKSLLSKRSFVDSLIEVSFNQIDTFTVGNRLNCEKIVTSDLQIFIQYLQLVSVNSSNIYCRILSSLGNIAEFSEFREILLRETRLIRLLYNLTFEENDMLTYQVTRLISYLVTSSPKYDISKLLPLSIRITKITANLKNPNAIEISHKSVPPLLKLLSETDQNGVKFWVIKSLQFAIEKKPNLFFKILVENNVLQILKSRLPTVDSSRLEIALSTFIYDLEMWMNKNCEQSDKMDTEYKIY